MKSFWKIFISVAVVLSLAAFVVIYYNNNKGESFDAETVEGGSNTDINTDSAEGNADTTEKSSDDVEKNTDSAEVNNGGLGVDGVDTTGGYGEIIRPKPVA